MARVKATARKITDYQPDPANPNQHTERGVSMLGNSLASVGLGRSIVVDKNGYVLAGNSTQERAVDQGFEDAIEVETDGTQMVVVRRVDLDLMGDDTKARALSYYDNRTSEVSLQWDAEQLLADVNAGFDFSHLFTDGELDALLAGLDTPLVGEDAGAQIDRAAGLQQKWQTERGQLWVIPSKSSKGAHRLLCGDSTNADDVATLLDGATDYVFLCDPFYGDDLIEKVAALFSFANAVFLTGGHQLRDILSRLDKFIEGVLLGCAAIPQMGQSAKPFYEHKVIVWTGKLKFRAGFSSVIEPTDRAARLHGDVYHHTTKPVDVVMRLLQPFSQTAVVDGFAGAGSGFVAAERMGRCCYGMELEPSYCAAILERLRLMGLEPRKHSDAAVPEVGR